MCNSSAEKAPFELRENWKTVTKSGLSVNVESVAVLRNVRGGQFPCPVLASRTAVAAGADSITVKFREENAKIRASEVVAITQSVAVPITIEISPTDRSLEIVETVLPDRCCLVPDRRSEKGMECGLNLAAPTPALLTAISRLNSVGVNVSILLSPDLSQILLARDIGFADIMIHTGDYALAKPSERSLQLQRIASAARVAVDLGLTCRAGRGLSYDNVSPIAQMTQISEVSIGHALISQSLFEGLPSAVDRFQRLLQFARHTV